ncbi:SRPBCC domain-containing protein [Nakamurella sp.]|uniref:SRPBCC domain-containing protein n=1 Tax=Nakamurella sp. TaxID=1869182 RepID=UPI003784D5DB
MSQPDKAVTPAIEVTIAAPIADVWAALREPGRLRNWHGWEYDLPDGTDALEPEIQTIYFNPAVTEEPPTRLSLGTDVFDLAEVDGGVRVRITRAPRGADPDWDAYYDDITEGWTTFLHQLKWAMERHPGDVRVTHFTAGTPLEPGPIVTRLGLAEIAAVPVGGDYAVTLPMGITLSGSVFFRTEQQFGLTVTEWGDGLLEVADSPPAPHRPVAGSAAILCLYGMSDAAVARLRTAWDGWWDGQFQPVTVPGEMPSAS